MDSILVVIEIRLFILLSLNFNMATPDDSIIHTIASETVVLLRLIFRSMMRIIAGVIVDRDQMMILIVAILGEKVGFFGRFLVRVRMVRLLIRRFPVKVKGAFGDLEIHGLECWSGFIKDKLVHIITNS